MEERKVEVDLNVEVEIEVEAYPEPTPSPSDPHMGPLDDDDDGRWLDPADRRRLAIERLRGRPFREED